MIRVKILDFIKKIIKLILIKKDFSILKQKSILIFDAEGSEIFLEYFKKNDLNILHVRKENINVLCLINTILSFNFDFRSYINTYIKLTKPKIILTFIDNTVIFHRIKKDNPEVITIFIQNGLRNFVPLSLTNEKNKVDYMFVINDNDGKRYSKYLEGKYISIGSFKLNFIIKKVLERKNNRNIFTFISQYRKGAFNNILYKAEKRILPMLLKYCLNNKIPLLILGISKNFTDNELEFKYYRKILGTNKGWKLKKRKNIFDNYFEMFNSKLVVSIDSFLGYEGVIFCKRLAIFSSRLKFENDKNRYHSPGCRVLKNKGEFWTTDTSFEEFKRIMKFALTSNNYLWNNIVNKYKHNIIDHDPENSKFINLMKKLNIPMKNG